MHCQVLLVIAVHSLCVTTLQSLFHIPEFRSVVLQFQPPSLPSPDQPHHHCLLFLVELRRLFALLVASRRKYINPQSAIQVSEAFLVCKICWFNSTRFSIMDGWSLKFFFLNELGNSVCTSNNRGSVCVFIGTK